MTVWAKETKRQVAEALFATRTIKKPNGSYVALDGRWRSIPRRIISRWQKQDVDFQDRWNELLAGQEQQVTKPLVSEGKTVLDMLVAAEKLGAAKLLEEVALIPTVSMPAALRDMRHVIQLLTGKPTEIMLQEVAGFWASVPEAEKDKWLAEAERELQAQQSLIEKAN